MIYYLGLGATRFKSGGTAGVTFSFSIIFNKESRLNVMEEFL